MSMTSKTIVALLAGISLVAFASQASAKTSAKRVAAIEKCTKVAMDRYPDANPRWHHGRYLAYEECMTNAGMVP